MICPLHCIPSESKCIPCPYFQDRKDYFEEQREIEKQEEEVNDNQNTKTI